MTGHINNYCMWNDKNKMYGIYHQMLAFGSVSQVLCSKMDIIGAHRHSVKLYIKTIDET